MIAVGRSLPGGSARKLRWIASEIETAKLDGPYDLAVAGESIHWTDWKLSFPRIREALSEDAMLAIVDRSPAPSPWDSEVHALIARYSTNRDYEPFDLEGELVRRGHFELLGQHRSSESTVLQTVEEYINALHSRNGLSRARMGATATRFDAELRELLRPHLEGDRLEVRTWAQTTWGRPH